MTYRTSDGPSTLLIDCDGCPARGRLCGDCFVPVLGRTWLDEPTTRTPGAPGTASPTLEVVGEAAASMRADQGVTQREPVSVRLDSDELAAVATFVRAGLVDPHEAAGLRAELAPARRAAV